MNGDKGSSLNDDITERQLIRRFYWVMGELRTMYWSRVVVADEFEVCGTYNRNYLHEPVISWSEVIVDGLGRLRGPAMFCC